MSDSLKCTAKLIVCILGIASPVAWSQQAVVTPPEGEAAVIDPQIDLDDFVVSCFAGKQQSAPLGEDASLLEQTAAGACDAAISARESVISDVNSRLRGFTDSLELVYIDPDGDQDSGLGVRVDWRKSFTGQPLFDGTSASSTFYDVSLFANGLLTESRSNNPNDYSKLGGDATLSLIRGGIDPEQATGKVYAWWLEQQRKRNDANLKPTEVDYFEGLRGTVLVDQHFASAAAQLYVEGDQRLDDRQYVFGLVADYGYTPVQPNLLTRLNPIDLPFKFTRSLSSYGNHVFGQRSIPLFRAAIEQVDPADNELREAVTDDDDSYTRLWLSASINTRIGTLAGHDVRFSAVHEYFYEFGADDEIEDAGLDKFDSTRLALLVPARSVFAGAPPGDIVISFARGQLPFDRRGDDVFELGWKFDFGVLSNALNAARP